MRRVVGVVGLGMLTWVLVAPGAMTVADATAAGDLVRQARTCYDRWSGPFDFDGYEASLRSAIALWEQALPLLPEAAIQSRSETLNSLSRAYFELAEGYLADPCEREAAYEAGKDAALASLRLDPVVVETEAREGFRASLRATSDVAAVFWYGNNIGQWLNYHLEIALSGGVSDVAASFERSVELDERYSGGGPQRALGLLLARAYFVVGRQHEDAVLHFERAIELDPTYLETRVSYAEHYARPTRDRELYDRLLDGVLADALDPEIMAAHPFYNHRAMNRAGTLAAYEW